jgi:hypothetical protein
LCQLQSNSVSLLQALLDHCRHRKPSAPAPPAHALFCNIVAAGAAISALVLLQALADGGELCGDWLAAHAALLLEKHPRFAEELALPPGDTQVRPALHQTHSNTSRSVSGRMRLPAWQQACFRDSTVRAACALAMLSLTGLKDFYAMATALTAAQNGVRWPERSLWSE